MFTNHIYVLTNGKHDRFFSRVSMLFFQITINPLPCSSRIGDCGLCGFVPGHILSTWCFRTQRTRSRLSIATVENADGFVPQGRRRIKWWSVRGNWSVIIIK